MAELPEDQRVDLRSAGGKGAGSFLLPPSLEEHVMPDAHFIAAVCCRLRAEAVAGVQGTCGHVCAETKARCGQPLDARGRHARICKKGGGVISRHDRIRDWLASVLRGSWTARC